MAVKIKICGVTNEEDATWAVNLGASYVGLNFHKDSPRKDFKLGDVMGGIVIRVPADGKMM